MVLVDACGPRCEVVERLDRVWVWGPVCFPAVVTGFFWEHAVVWSETTIGTGTGTGSGTSLRSPPNCIGCDVRLVREPASVPEGGFDDTVTVGGKVWDTCVNTRVVLSGVPPETVLPDAGESTCGIPAVWAAACVFAILCSSSETVRSIGE